MFKSRLSGFATALALLAGFVLAQPALASYAVPEANMSRGQVQAVNFAANTVTVNGHAYKISAQAVYAGEGVNNMGGLQAGMKIEFIANGPLDDPASVITNIVVLPPTSQ